MQIEEVIASEHGVVLVRALDHDVTVYVVTCERVPRMQVFDSLAQAVECYGLELLSVSRFVLVKKEER